MASKQSKLTTGLMLLAAAGAGAAIYRRREDIRALLARHVTIECIWDEDDEDWNREAPAAAPDADGAEPDAPKAAETSPAAPESADDASTAPETAETESAAPQDNAPEI
ncbi:MAG: hypothetical protein LUD54_04035 [Oscillospiraceae bacterium]|nr:hypothetical protein [Oscillospiraceae bacterium]